MSLRCRFCWSLFGLFFLAVAGFAGYTFVTGLVMDSKDGRTAVVLNEAERDLVLTEMRGFLEAVEGIVDGVVEDDMAAVATSAGAVGMGVAESVPLTLMAKLPLEMKTLGMETHAAFDTIAREAEDMGDSKEVLRQLRDTLGNCTACHASYRLAVTKDAFD
jgi:hypothetical protein